MRKIFAILFAVVFFFAMGPSTPFGSSQRPAQKSAEVPLHMTVRKLYLKARYALNRIVVQAKAAVSENYLQSADYGYLIENSNGVTLWWTDGVRKISRERPAPTAPVKRTLEFYCAKNEYEPMQLVLRADRDLTGVSAAVSPLQNDEGKRLPLEAVQILMVDYVPVERPTDEVGIVGDWPDPLPPLEGRFDLKKDTNQPLWILVYIPSRMPAGDYRGEIKLRSEDWQASVPIRVHVWDFELPRTSHLQSAFGFAAWWVKDYHHIDDEKTFRRVLDKYFRSFAAHRISPYDPFVLDGIEATFDDSTLTVKCNFDKFDAAAHRYLDELGFNSFRLSVKGLSGGTFHSQRVGRIGKYAMGTPEYETMMKSYLSQIEAHLRERNWLDKAYIYWFDEPQEKHYDFVKQTMALLDRAAPGLTRMLTEQPEPELYGYVDLWCPVTFRYDHQRAQERRALGEKFWWYICTSPKAPYCTLFIDHYAVELRTWIWQSWKYGLDGILIWQSNYWTSPTAFPKPKRQNPYEDPMSYRTGYGMKPGEIMYWGNGDGRFIYPPKSVFESEEPNEEGPVSSIRWEMLREGMEDYEYLWLLRDLVQKGRERGLDEQTLQRAEALLEVPESITKELDDFSKSPQPIFEHRQKVAQMIEALRKLM